MFYNRTCFPEYNGQDEYDQALAYIESKFDQMNDDPQKVPFLLPACMHWKNSFQLVYRQVTSTIDTENVRHVM